jgi:hypothetical protein
MWMLNNKHFRLLDLPIELRSQIYQYVLGGEFILSAPFPELS